MENSKDAIKMPKESGDTALLVIDIQKGLFQKNIPIYKADELLDNIISLVQRAHAANMPFSTYSIRISGISSRILMAGNCTLACGPWSRIALSSRKKATPSKVRTWM